MNSGFVLEQAAAFAVRVRELSDDTPLGLVKSAWELALGRPSRPEEARTAEGFLARNSLPLLCLLLYNLNEFAYVD